MTTPTSPKATKTDFNNLTGDNLTEIIKYLNPHDEENKFLRGQIKEYEKMKALMKKVLEKEYTFSGSAISRHFPHGHGTFKRRFAKKTIAPLTHEDISNIYGAFRKTGKDLKERTAISVKRRKEIAERAKVKYEKEKKHNEEWLQELKREYEIWTEKAKKGEELMKLIEK